MTAPAASTTVEPRARSAEPIRFSIHGLATVEIEAGFPFSQSVEEDLGPFVTADTSEPPHVLIKAGTGDDGPRCSASGLYEYTDDATWILEYDVSVSATDNGYKLTCRRDPLPFLQPLIQHRLLSQEYALIHAAAVTVDGEGVAIPAWGGTGKTSAVVGLTRLPGVGFVSDDFCILSGSGQVLSYPKPFFVYPYHRALFPHLFRGKRKPLVPPWLLPVVQRLREASRPVFMRYPRLERLARRITPEHMKIPARTAVPEAQFVDIAPLRAVLFAARHSGDTPSLQPYDRERAVRRVVGNWLMEIGAPAQQLLIGCCSTSLWSLDHLIHELHKIVGEAFANVPVYDLRIPHSLPPDATGQHIARSVRQVLEGGGC